LLSFLILVFLVIAPITTFYAIGWRFDFKTNKFYEIGALFLKIQPKNTEIWIDGKLNKKTDFLFGSVLIEGLLPKTYSIQIKKDGYNDWQKDFEVKKREVTEAKNIFLFPKNPELSVLSQNTDALFLGKNDKQILFKKINEEDAKNIFWELYSLDLKTGERKLILSQKDILRAYAPQATSKEAVAILNGALSLDSKKIVVTTEIKGKTYYYFFDTNKKEQGAIAIKEDLSKINFQPFSGNGADVLFLKNNKIYGWSSDKKTSSLLYQKDVLSFAISENGIYFIDPDGYIYSSDVSFSNPSKINDYAFPIKKNGNYNIEVKEPRVFLQEDSSLYLLDKENNNFKQISLLSEQYSLSPDKKRLAYSKDGELFVFFIENIQERPERQFGQEIKIAKFPGEKISQIYWLNDYYLIIKVGDNIKITDTDNRGKINIINFASLPNLQGIAWSIDGENLFALAKGNLYISKKLKFGF
jgi:hypothetical protein